MPCGGGAPRELTSAKRKLSAGVKKYRPHHNCKRSCVWLLLQSTAFECDRRPNSTRNLMKNEGTHLTVDAPLYPQYRSDLLINSDSQSTLAFSLCSSIDARVERQTIFLILKIYWPSFYTQRILIFCRVLLGVSHMLYTY